ncbi:MAG: DUF2867 domain-containing protein [Gracilibacteraceae bacterium]|jgi:hypothetical protein|nr:DUF2867 domain-containing protein [Gracilibacteraceae bacterium]
MKRDEAPENSAVFSGFGRVDYIDSYQITKSTDESIEKISAQIFKLPAWVNFLMKIRDALVRPFGLKGKEDESEAGGEFFTKIEQTENELVMGENDRHLNFRVSVLADRAASLVYVTTVVRYNNKMGKVYFFFVKPFHKIIVRSVMKRYGTSPDAGMRLPL